MTDDADDMHARHLAILREFQADGVELARELKALAQKAIRAEEREPAERLTVAWHRLTRSVRQSLALEAKFKRDMAQAAREAEAYGELAAAVAERRIRRHARIGNQLIWTEAETNEAVETWASFLDRVAEEHPPEDHAKKVAAIRANPDAYLRWLDERVRHTQLELDAARSAIARGVPIVGGPLAELPDDILPTYGVEPDSS